MYNSKTVVTGAFKSRGYTGYFRPIKILFFRAGCKPARTKIPRFQDSKIPGFQDSRIPGFRQVVLNDYFISSPTTEAVGSNLLLPPVGGRPG
jgi:hypothetical protein